VDKVSAGEVSGATSAPPRTAPRLHSWLVPGGLLLVLVFLTVNVLAHGPMLSLDEHIRSAVQHAARSPSWRWLGDSPAGPAWLLTYLGANFLAVPVLAVTALALAVRRHTARPLTTAAVGVALLLVTVIPAKIIIGRPGPGQPAVAPGGLGAFPSGHTATACVCLSLAVFLLVEGQPSHVRRTALAALAAMWLLVGAALLWCDYHWFIDVVASWALSVIILQATLWVSRSQASRMWARRLASRLQASRSGAIPGG
jgi:membrane-associated phospholipid phosphatase